MAKYDPHIHHRRTIRLKGYDYSRAGLYYLTLCVEDRINLSGEIKNGKMILNPYGKIAKSEWQKTPDIRKNCSLGEFVIMPNHFHAILSIDFQIENNNSVGTFQSPSQTIGAIIRGFKGATTKKIKEYFIENFDNEFNNNCRGELQFAPTDETTTTEGIAPTEMEEILLFLKNKISNKKSIWQRNYWEHIIRSKKHYLLFQDILSTIQKIGKRINSFNRRKNKRKRKKAK